MLLRFGENLYDHRHAVIGAWVLLAVVLLVLSPSWNEVARDGDLDHLPADTTTARATALYRAAFPDEAARSQLLVVFVREGGPLVREDLQLVAELRDRITQIPDLPLVEVLSEKADGTGMLPTSRDDRARRFAVLLKNDFMATDNVRVLADVRRVVDEAMHEAPAGLHIGITGSAAIGGDLLSAAAESVRNTHTTTLILVVAVLAVIYRSWRLMLVPLMTITAAVSVSLAVLPLLVQLHQHYPTLTPDIQVFTTTKIFVIVLLFGAGTDYCLFLTARFLECRAAGLDTRGATAEAFSRVGVALAASGATTIVGLGMMAAADFGKIASSGESIAVCLLITLVACLTLTPALLATLLTSVGPRYAERSPLPVWSRLADLVVSRPRTLLLASVAAALPLAWCGASVRVTHDLLSEIGPNRISRRGTALLERSYAPGEVGPLMVLAKQDGVDFTSAEGRDGIAHLGKLLYETPGVSRVRSLDQPLGDPPGTNWTWATVARRDPKVVDAFVSPHGQYAGRLTRLVVILKDAPFSAEAVDTCDRIVGLLDQVSGEDGLWHGADFELLGPTSGIRDLARVTTSDRRRVQLLVTAAVYLVMVVLLRRPLICGYLVATVLLSYLVTIGATSLFFGLLRGDEFLGLDWKVPLFLFVLLVAVGQDYNIYLVSRVFEEQKRRGPIEGIRHALIQTGGIITSCGVIMAGTFVSMTTGSMHGIVELGFALSLGILLDTLYVRTVMVPALLALLGGKGRQEGVEEAA